MGSILGHEFSGSEVIALLLAAILAERIAKFGGRSREKLADWFARRSESSRKRKSVALEESLKGFQEQVEGGFREDRIFENGFRFVAASFLITVSAILSVVLMQVWNRPLSMLFEGESIPSYVSDAFVLFLSSEAPIMFLIISLFAALRASVYYEETLRYLRPNEHIADTTARIEALRAKPPKAPPT